MNKQPRSCRIDSVAFFVFLGIALLAASLLGEFNPVQAQPPAALATAEIENDDAPYLQQLLDSAPSGATVLLPARVYTLQRGLKIERSLTLQGLPGTVFHCSDASEPVFTINPDGYGQAVSRVEDEELVSGQDRLRIADPELFAGSSYGKVFDQQQIGSYLQGELVEIGSIQDQQLLLRQGLLADYRRDRQAAVRPVRMLERVAIRGIDFIGPGAERQRWLLSAFLVREFSFQQCRVSDFGSGALALTDCLDGDIGLSSFDTVFRTGLGYSIAVFNASDRIAIHDCSFTAGRHFIAAGASSGSYLNGGFPKTITVRNNFFSRSSEEAVNSHPPFAGPLIITGNVFSDCGKGIEISNGQCRIQGNSFDRCQSGIELYGELTGPYLIEGNLFRDNGRSLKLSADNLTVLGNYAVDSPAVIFSPTNLVFRHNTLISADRTDDIPLNILGTLTASGRTLLLQNNLIAGAAGACAVNLEFIEGVWLTDNTIANGGQICSRVVRNLRCARNLIEAQEQEFSASR